MTNKKVAVIRVGIDVGATELVVVIHKNGTAMKAQSFANTAADHGRLIRRLAKYTDLIVCLEATGSYHLDLAIALHDAGLAVMVLNPKVSHNFAKVLLKNSKTDAVDADTLAQYAECMPYQAWARPDNAMLSLRHYARRINALTQQKTVAKNQHHALSVTAGTPEAVQEDVAVAIAQLDARIDALSRDARTFIDARPALQQPLDWLMTIKGVAQASAIALLGELLLLPEGLTHKQWVKFAGLDPKHFRSGTSVEKRARISKAGNRYIRQALYMPALCAKRHDPYVKGFFEHLVARGKTKMQAVCAVMRKLLHAIHGMLTHNQPFDNTRFYATPAGASAGGGCL